MKKVTIKSISIVGRSLILTLDHIENGKDVRIVLPIDEKKNYKYGVTYNYDGKSLTELKSKKK